MIEDKLITDRTPAEILRKCEFWLEDTELGVYPAKGYCRLAGKRYACDENRQCARLDCPVMKGYMSGIADQRFAVQRRMDMNKGVVVGRW